MTVIADENPGIVLFFPVRAAKEASILQQAKADMALMLSLVPSFSDTCSDSLVSLVAPDAIWTRTSMNNHISQFSAFIFSVQPTG